MSYSTSKARILIVDDHPIVREGLALRINRQPDLEVCGEAGDYAAALRQLEIGTPQLVLIDLLLEQGPGGLDLVREIKARYPHVATLVLSMRDERVYALRALQAGAHGYIMKHEASEKVLEGIRHVLRGEIYVSPAISQQVLAGLAGDNATKRPSPSDLTDRELEVFRLVGQSLSTRDIAERLYLSVKTIETYYERIKTRLGLEGQRDLVREAVLWVHEHESR